MISLKVPVKEYENSSNEEKSKIFEELAQRILSVHPEYMEIARTSKAKDICQDIMNETQDTHILTKREERKVKKLIKKKYD